MTREDFKNMATLHLITAIMNTLIVTIVVNQLIPGSTFYLGVAAFILNIVILVKSSKLKTPKIDAILGLVCVGLYFLGFIVLVFVMVGVIAANDFDISDPIALVTGLGVSAIPAGLLLIAGWIVNVIATIFGYKYYLSIKKHAESLDNF